MDSTYITFLLLPFLFDPLTLEAIPRFAWPRRRVAPTPEKKGIRESHAPCERSGAAVDSDVPRHKNDSRRRADALAGVISPEPVTAVSRKAGKANSIAFHCDNRNFCEGQPESLASRIDDFRNRLICGPSYSSSSGEPTFTAKKGIVYSRAPPFENLRLHGETACPRFRIRGARNRLRTRNPGKKAVFRIDAAQVAASDLQ
jgi:hypothetical protein